MEASNDYPAVKRGEGWAACGLEDLGDGPGFRKVRRALDVDAFGVNAIVLPAGMETGFHYHDAQEELYFVHRGTIEMVFGDGSTITLGEGGLARVDAATVRQIRNVGEQRRRVSVRRRQGRVRRARRARPGGRAGPRPRAARPRQRPGGGLRRPWPGPSDGGLRVQPRLSIPLEEVKLRTSRSSGPGGQHANVTASRVEAVFDVHRLALAERVPARAPAAPGGSAGGGGGPGRALAGPQPRARARAPARADRRRRCSGPGAQAPTRPDARLGRAAPGRQAPGLRAQAHPPAPAPGRGRLAAMVGAGARRRAPRARSWRSPPRAPGTSTRCACASCWRRSAPRSSTSTAPTACAPRSACGGGPRRTRPELIVMEGTGIAGGLCVLALRTLRGIPYVVSSGDAVGPYLALSSHVAGLLGGAYERLLCRRCAGLHRLEPVPGRRALSFGAPRAMTAAGWAREGAPAGVPRARPRAARHPRGRARGRDRRLAELAQADRIRLRRRARAGGPAHRAARPGGRDRGRRPRRRAPARARRRGARLADPDAGPRGAARRWANSWPRSTSRACPRASTASAPSATRPSSASTSRPACRSSPPRSRRRMTSTRASAGACRDPRRGARPTCEALARLLEGLERPAIEQRRAAALAAGVAGASFDRAAQVQRVGEFVRDILSSAAG